MDYLRKLEQLVPTRLLGSSGSLINVSTIKDIEAGSPRRDYYMPRGTIILGKDIKNPSSAEWRFDAKRLLRVYGEGFLDDNTQNGITLEKIILRICAVRTHACLQVDPVSGQKAVDEKNPKAGRVYVNSKLIDKINIMKQMPNGLSWGFNRVGPWDITDIVCCCESQQESQITIKVETDIAVRWDISYVSIEPWVGVPLKLF